jgi:peptide/nickel transport system permease protein
MTIATTATAIGPAEAAPGILARLIRRPAGLIGILIVAGAIVVALLAPVLAPYNPNQLDPTAELAGPSATHLLGTDALGRDNLSRVIYGSRLALGLAVSAILIAFVIGLTLGVAAAYLGGLVERVVLVLCDSLLVFPSVILALALLSLLGSSLLNTVIVIGVAYVPYYARISRAQTLAIQQNTWVKAERALGASRPRILARHLGPNILPPLVILIAMDVPGAIAIEAGLAYLGLGVQPPTADWGVMLNDGFSTMNVSLWPVIAPIAALIIVSIGFTLIGETFRDVVDPNLVSRRRMLGAWPGRSR